MIYCVDMKLVTLLLFIPFITLGAKSVADEVSAGIQISGGTSDQQRTIRDTLSEINKRFPTFVQLVKSAGLKSVLIAEAPRVPGELGWAGDGQGNIWIFPRALIPVLVSDLAPDLQIKMVLIHEMGHFFPPNNTSPEAILQLTGWKSWSPSMVEECNRRFEDPSFKCGYGGRKADFLTIETSWISEDDYMKERAAVKGVHGQEPLEAQLVFMRQRLMKYGYPSAYSITGGPGESFPEFVSYIAFDPKAKEYIPEPTLKWFTENVLK